MSSRRPSLAPLLKRYQELLGLGDWRITAKYATLAAIRKQLPDAGNGCVAYDNDHKTAQLLILDPATCGKLPGELAPQSVRFWLLHELLHLHTQRLVGDAVNPAEEQVINTLARAFESLL